MDDVLAEHRQAIRRARVSVIFVDDREIQQLNHQFLDRDWPTDVIAFDLSDYEGYLEGEIYVSVETAQRQAVEHGIGFWSELERLAVHGALHLAGLDDTTEPGRLAMTREEDRLLAGMTGC